MGLPENISDTTDLTVVVRSALVYLGLIQALVVGKVAVLAVIRDDRERAFGYSSFALAILTPALYMIEDFDRPLTWLTAVYALAVSLGSVWVMYRVRFDLRWFRLVRYHRRSPDGIVVTEPSHRR